MDSGVLATAKPRGGKPADKTVTTKTINLALQGGGAHGAFTWGVLDRLLEEERIAIEGISATSAGAMNAAVFTYGYALGGRDGAKKALAGFWRRISQAAALMSSSSPGLSPSAGGAAPSNRISYARYGPEKLVVAHAASPIRDRKSVV